MTATWMLASTLVALVLAAAARMLAGVAALYRDVALRWIWVLAMVTSVVASAAWLRATPVKRPSPPSIAVAASTLPASPASGALPTPPVVRTLMSSWTRPELPRVPARFDGIIVALWAAGSSILLLSLGAATVRIARERRRWREQEIASTSVLVSETFGPAIVGLTHPAIIIPEWVLALEDESQRAIVAHEDEHRRARDPLLLLLALVAVIVMPWNIGLWLAWRGLRRAIELDCDARVLTRGIDSTQYASVLLGAWRSAHESWMPSTAFAERASALGARVEHLMRPEPQRRIMRTTVGTLAAAGLVFIACSTPAPRQATADLSAPYPLVLIDGVKRADLPPRYHFVGPVVAETTTVPSFRIQYRGRQEEDTAARRLYPSMEDGTIMQTIDAPSSVLHFGPEAKYGAVLYYTRKYREAGGKIIAPDEGKMGVRAASPSTSTQEKSQAVYRNLFNGTTLTPERTAQALAIIDTFWVQLDALHGPMLVSWPRLQELVAIRDARLRALLTTGDERSRFDTRTSEGRPRPLTAEIMAQNMVNNFFGDPAISADVRQRANAIVMAALTEELALYRRDSTAFDARLAIRDRRDTELRALVPTDSARKVFDWRAARVRTAEVKP